MSVVKINAITVPADSGDELAQRFAARAGAVDNQAGFEGFELLKPTDDRHHLAGGDPLAGRGVVPGVAELARRSAHGHRSAAERAGGEAPKPVGVHSELWSYEVAGGSPAGALSGIARCPTDPWADRAFLRGVQYKTDANLAARQSIYAFQHPRDRPAGAGARPGRRPPPSGLVADIGCGNGRYLAELARRGFPGRVLGVDLSPACWLRPAAAARARARGRGAPPPDRPPAVARRGLVAPTRPRCRCRTARPDLALAMHMLYHVPDPADAVRELRRVTRPGGRVVIVPQRAQATCASSAPPSPPPRRSDPATLVERDHPRRRRGPWRGPSSPG